MVAQWTRKAEQSGELAAAAKGNGLSERLFPLMIEEEQLLQRFGPEHPKVLALRRQIEMTRKLHAELEEHEAARAELDKDDGPATDSVQSYLASIERELGDLDSTDQALAKMFEQEKADAKNLMNYEFQDNQFASEIARAGQFHDTLIKQLQGIDLGKDLGGYQTSVIAPATIGGRVEPRLLPIFLVAGILGTLGGVGLAWLAELTDKRFRDADEIRRRLGLPVVGHIPHFDVQLRSGDAAGPALAASLCAFHRSKSSEAEAYRGVRTALYFNIRGQQHKVIQVTSPVGSDGKTTLSSNLAISIAQSGMKTLLIDADLRKPNIHKLFNLENTLGLASVIADGVELDDAVQPSQIENLSVLASGPPPANPAELLTSPRFKELLDVIRERYDFVLIDTPPLLAVTDPCVVAPRVDGVLLTLRVTKDARPQAQRARHILGSLKATILGVVVNDIEPNGRMGYGYGGYHYGYGYGLGYGYETDPDAHANGAEVASAPGPRGEV
jgi:capsular exopolysaccharide synthesis family protein